jgi:hypothetical protein
MISVSRLNNVDDRTINKYGAVGRMGICKETEVHGKNSRRANFPPQIPYESPRMKPEPPW